MPKQGKRKIWRKKHPNLPHIQQIQSEGTDTWQTIRVTHWIIDTSKQDNGVYVEYLNEGKDHATSRRYALRARKRSRQRPLGARRVGVSLP